MDLISYAATSGININQLMKANTAKVLCYSSRYILHS